MLARTVLTCSQFTDPRSVCPSDQTRLIARGGWVALRFTAAQVERARVSRRTVTGWRGSG